MQTTLAIRLIVPVVLVVTVAFTLLDRSHRQTALAQLSTSVNAYSSLWGLGDADLERIGKEYPNDPQAQFASTLVSNPAVRLQAQRALAGRHLDNAPVLAALLRSENREKIGLDNVKTHGTPPIADLRAYDAEAAQGEAVDPGNAYFPTMRAVGYYLAGDHASAERELHKAARMHDFREYIPDEGEALWHDCDLTLGWTPVFTRWAEYGGILFPHYAQIRAAARLAAADAQAAEKSGNLDKGLEIRLDTLRVGGLMRAHSTASIGSLVGVAITRIATAHPDGLDAPGASNLTGMTRDAARCAFFLAYLRRHGAASAVGPVSRELAAGVAVKNIYESAKNLDIQGDTDLAGAWMFGYEVLGNLFGAILIWLMAEGWLIATRRRRFVWESWMILPAVDSVALIGALIAGLTATGMQGLAQPIAFSVAAVLGVMWAALCLRTLMKGRDRFRKAFLVRIFVTLPIVLLLIIAAFEVRAIAALMTCFDPDGAKELLTPEFFLEFVGCQWIAPGLALLIGWAATLGAPRRGSRPRRMELMSIVACCLSICSLVFYSRSLLLMDRIEPAADARVQAFITNEASWRAELVGKSWPGETAWPND